MKKKDIIMYTCIMAMFSILTLDISARALMGRSVIAMPHVWHSAPKQTVDNNLHCSDRPEIKDLAQAQDPQLQKLAQYQQVCHSAVTSHMMIFNDMPNSDQAATDNGKKMAATLKEFHKYGVTPVVIAEPVTSWGDIDFTEFKSGFYDAWITKYFQTIKAQGIPTSQMGTWVPFPEANLPYWNRQNATPADFAAIVNKYLLAAHQSYPDLQASIMLNSATYDANDFDWSRGEYVSLVPYVKDIKKGLVQSFGLQGFPWMPPANGDGAGIFDAGEFLNYRLAKEAADSLGVKNIWLNTGTFNSKYVGDPQKQVWVSPEKRADILNGILAQAKTLQTQGYTVSVNVFAQDKGQQTEATDWSYFSNNSVQTSPASPVFANFAARLNNENIELWLFDRM
jgi:hypothetical protein